MRVMNMHFIRQGDYWYKELVRECSLKNDPFDFWDQLSLDQCIFLIYIIKLQFLINLPFSLKPKPHD